MRRISVFAIAIILVASAGAKEKLGNMKQARTYAQYTFPVDPAYLYWTGDQDLSYALASTLVQWDEKKQIRGSVASAWKKLNPTTFSFTIHPGLKWSNGAAVTSRQVKQSFERAFKTYPDDLRSLIKMVDSIECPDDSTLDFRLREESKNANLLGKLTEPQYGILYIDKDGKPNLGVTTGAFYAAQSSGSEIILNRNPNWVFFSGDVAENIIVRKPKGDYDHQRVLLTDDWANVTQTHSLMPQSLMDQYRSGGFSTWTRPRDRVYILTPSKSVLEKGQQDLLRFIDSKLDRKILEKNLAGFSIADQIFPHGYQLYDPDYKRTTGSVTLPAEFKARPIKILAPGGQSSAIHIQNIQAAITAATGIAATVEFIPMDAASARRKKGDYDLYMESVGLADPDPEGLMSYYFEGGTAVIPSTDGTFLKRLDAARALTDEKKRLQAMRSILTDAKNGGFVLPIYQMSTIGIGRAGVDLSKVAETDESVPFSKIRFSPAKAKQ